MLGFAETSGGGATGGGGGRAMMLGGALKTFGELNAGRTFGGMRTPGFAAKNEGGGGGGGKRIPRAPGGNGGGGGGGGIRLVAAAGVPNSGSSFWAKSFGLGSLHRLTTFAEGSEKRIRRRSDGKGIFGVSTSSSSLTSSLSLSWGGRPGGGPGGLRETMIRCGCCSNELNSFDLRIPFGAPSVSEGAG